MNFGGPINPDNTFVTWKVFKMYHQEQFWVIIQGRIQDFEKAGAGLKRPFFFHQDAKLLRTQPPFRNPPLLDQHWVTLGWRDVRRQFFAPPFVWVVANIQGRCETKVVCRHLPWIRLSLYISIWCCVVRLSGRNNFDF